MSKKDDLSTLHEEYLAELSLSLSKNPPKRIGNCRKEEYVSNISTKVSKVQVNEILDLYSSGVPAETVGEMLSPDDVDVILGKLDGFFHGQGFREAKVGKRRCDFVIPEDLTAIEVKSERDNLEKAEHQVSDYNNWADRVYLAYDQSHRDKIPDSIRDAGVGLLEYNGHIQEIQKPERSPADDRELLTIMTRDYLIEITEYYGINQSGDKSDIANRLNTSLSNETIRLWFQRFLIKRAKFRGN